MFARRLFFVGNVLLLLTLIGVAVLALWPLPRGYYEAPIEGMGADSQPTESLIATMVGTRRGVISPWLAVVIALAIIAVVVVGLRNFRPKPLSKTTLIILAVGALAFMVLVFCVWLLSFLLSTVGFSDSPGGFPEVVIIGGDGGSGSVPGGGSTSGSTGGAAVATSTPEATSTPAAPPPQVVERNMLIEAEWPTRMAVGTSDSIRISLIRTSEDEYVATVEVEGHQAIAATPFPVGTPEAPIEGAFGPDYEASVTATLVGGAFGITPVTSETQSLDQNPITWEWNIVSNQPGGQTINAEIVAEWYSTGDEKDVIQRPIWRSRFNVIANEPLFTRGTVSIMSLVGGFIGSGLSLPWLFEQVRDAIKGRKKTEEKEEAGEEGVSVKVPPPAARPPGKAEKPAKKQ